MTALLAVAVVLVPGAILAWTVPRGPERWGVLAAAPALSYGLISLTMAWLPVAHLPNSAADLLLAELLVAALATVIAVGLRRRGDRSTAQRRIRTPWLPRRRALDLLAVTVPAVAAMTMGILLLRGTAAAPGWDGQNHGFLVRQILDRGHATIATACASGSTKSVVSCQFYPLAGNISWAQAVQLGGGHVSLAMIVTAAVTGPLVLVTGAFAFVRYLGASRAVATAVATAVAFIGPLWTSMLTGRVTEELGPALSPAVALLIVLALRGRHRLIVGALAGLASAGLVMTHTYEALFVAVLALAGAASMKGGASIRRGRVPAVLVGVLGGLVGLALAIGPLAKAVVSARGERAQPGAPVFAGHWEAAAQYWVTHLMRYVPLGYPGVGAAGYPLHHRVTHLLTLGVAAAIVLAVPGCLLRELRWARPWVVAWAVFTAIGIWTGASRSSIASGLSGLWYGTPERLRIMMFPVYGILAVAGVCAACHLLARLLRRLPRVSRGSAALPGVAALVAAAALVSVVAVPSEWQPLRDDLARHAPEGPQYARTFGWLKEHTPAGQVVAWDRNVEYLSWANADYGVPALFGIPPLHASADWPARRQAFWWLTDRAKTKPAGCQVRHFDIAYVAVGRTTIPSGIFKRTYSPARLATSPNLRLVHADGGLEVYAVTPAGEKCPN